MVNREEEGGENPTLMTFKIDWSMFTRVRDAEDRKRCRCFHDDPLQPRDGTSGCYKMMVTVGVVAQPVCVRRLEFILSNIQTF